MKMTEVEQKISERVSFLLSSIELHRDSTTRHKFAEPGMSHLEEIMTTLAGPGHFLIKSVNGFERDMKQKLSEFYFDFCMIEAAKWYKDIFHKEICEERTSCITGRPK